MREVNEAEALINVQQSSGVIPRDRNNHKKRNESISKCYEKHMKNRLCGTVL